MELKDWIAIVTGPAKGMGAAITIALAREGADLVLAGRDVAAIEPVAAELAALGRRAEIVACDVTKAADVADMVARALAFGGGRIDILVNVAGGSGPIETPSWETTPEEFDADRRTQHERLLPDDARGAADDDGAELRQDRQCRRHVRIARPRLADGLQRQQMGAARHHQERRARSRPV